jgi:hypothetical protein
MMTRYSEGEFRGQSDPCPVDQGLLFGSAPSLDLPLRRDGVGNAVEML